MSCLFCILINNLRLGRIKGEKEAEMGVKQKSLLVGVLAILCIALTLSAAEIHVPADYTTIQKAVDAAAAGDTIIVAAGTYVGVSIGEKSDLTLRGESGAVINGRIVISNCTNIVIEGFQITSPQEGILVLGAVNGLTIRNNDIVNCGLHGITFAVDSSYTNVLIEGNTVNKNGYDGIQLLGTAVPGTGETPLPPVTIRGNHINNNGQRADTGVGIRVGRHNPGVVIENNEITGNSFAGIHPA